MTLASILSVDQIITQMDSKNRWEVIDELIQKLVDCGKITAEKAPQIVEAVKKRESSMSTGVGFGVGLPHASTQLIDDVIGVFGRSSDGVNFDALDNQPVKFVVLFLVPQGQFQKHLQTLGNIARLLHRKDMRQAIEEAKTAEEIFNVIKEFSEPSPRNA
ncbi:MAG: PTS sugar transporter subunit IIA [Verrucomicrobia bacterium]|nr:PTS sugar transporter subunit IIA [Verrucomicrobiota bacterium]MBR5691784.1 PTS sugar transporter subunit IIA [Verrucomicrobiota bacterium]MBR5737688.1 PTS sugar transporter subunit IIA [Verrucomicrobiota bacterium]MBR5978010.1 PTS sugar transporter subunit IIA [Verrucomicrobiota bacterium]MBR6460226.1 PTS sugar transporter subunit IIA [Verrucomicrobiota bacterium]